jgi:hypothetical protein
MRTDSKMIELMGMLGEITSENFSPTLRAKLVGINEYAGVCTMEVTESHYKDGVGAKHNHKVGTLYEAPVYRIWNAFFF